MRSLDRAVGSQRSPVSAGSRDADAGERLEDEPSIGAARAAPPRRARGGASGRTRCRLRLTIPAMPSCEPFGLAAASTLPFAIAVAQDHAARARRARRSCPRRARSAGAAPGRRGTRRVNGVSVRSTRHHTHSRAELRATRCAASRPGSSPASSSTWKPLQMPRTSPPASANVCDAAP